MNVLEYLGNSYNKNTQSFDAEAARKESYENKPKLNIVLFGATGVGKSALVNAMFGKNIVESGVTPAVKSVQLNLGDFNYAA